MTVTTFGTMTGGRTVHRIDLQNGPLRVSLLTLGAVVQGVWLRGIPYSLTLGSDRLADYERDMRYHGSLVAPVVNRLTNARAPIAGVLHRFEANQDGLHTLHSGSIGGHLQVWRVANVTPRQATLTLTLPDGAGGFPGLRPLKASFSLPDETTLRLKLTTTTDKPTLSNAANHSYWNLGGTPDWSGHSLQIDADHNLPTTDSFAPTGKITTAAGTAFDFRQPRIIRPGSQDLDHCFCLADGPRALTPALTLTGQSGVSMTMATTQPAVQIYDGRAAIRPGRATDAGFAIEAQNWPDAPNHPGFPNIDLLPGQICAQTTEWRFKYR